MHTHFFLINRSQYAMQNHFFQCKRFASATHIVSFHIGNIPYAPGTAIPFGPGLKNPAGLMFIFSRGLENRIRIRSRFIRGIENPAGLMFIFIRGIKNRIGIRFIRPLTWPFVGAYAIRPYTGTRKNGDFSIRSITAVVVCGAYAVAPYTGDLKNGNFSVCSATGVAVCRAYAIRPYPTGQKFIEVSVRFYPGN